MSFSEYRGKQKSGELIPDATSKPTGWYTDDDGSQYFIDKGGNKVNTQFFDPYDMMKSAYKFIKPALEALDKRGKRVQSDKIFKDWEMENLRDYKIGREIENLKDFAYKNNVRSSKKTIKWRPEYGEYISDFDYNIRLLQEARKGKE